MDILPVRLVPLLFFTVIAYFMIGERISHSHQDQHWLGGRGECVHCVLARLSKRLSQHFKKSNILHEAFCILDNVSGKGVNKLNL